MNMISRAMCVVITAGTVCGAPPAWAGDLNPPAGPIAPTPGPEPRIPINATNTPGDANSVFRIAAPGSYYLTGNLTGLVGDHGIEIAASGVTIDLMGFELLGVVGSLDGLAVTVAGLSNIEVRNGSVRSWGENGLDLATSAPINVRVSDVRTSSNTRNGMQVGQCSRISDCIAQGNLVSGIFASSHCVLTGCVARENEFSGFEIGSGSTVTGCVAGENGTSGMEASVNCTITGCTLDSNGTRGVNVIGECTISGCTATDNIQDGIRAGSDCRIVGNTCDDNGSAPGTGVGAGIHLIGGDCRVEGNNCTDNDRGLDVDVAGNIIIRNTCAGNTTANWDIVANNVCGPILDRTAPASAVIVGNVGASSLGSTDPNANFTY